MSSVGPHPASRLLFGGLLGIGTLFMSDRFGLLSVYRVPAYRGYVDKQEPTKHWVFVSTRLHSNEYLGSNYKTNRFEAAFVIGAEGMWMKSKEVNTAFNVPRGQLLLHNPIKDEAVHEKGSFEFTAMANSKGTILWSYPSLDHPNARFEPFN